MSASILASPVQTTYQHSAKLCRPGPLLRAGGARLKWYAIAPEDIGVEPEIVASARAYISGGNVPGLSAGDLGFAVLHRCGATFHFLLVQVWRGSNELWQAVHYHDRGMDGFAPFADAYPAQSGMLRPTYCVWELGVIGAEMAAWRAYLESQRVAADADRYLATAFAGAV